MKNVIRINQYYIISETGIHSTDVTHCIKSKPVKIPLIPQKRGSIVDLDYKSIGKRIRELRTARKWTQETLAEISSVEPSNISHIERGATKVSLPTLIRIANALEATLDELVYGSLVKSGHVSVKAIDELLSDCSPAELAAIAETVRHTKEILRRYGNR